MKIRKIIYFFSIFFLLSFIRLNAEIPHFIDFKYILNESDAGKKAQTFLKNKLEKGFKNIREKEKKIQKERNEILKSVADKRAKAKNELLKNLNPIMKDYMKEKNIKMIVDKKSLLLADENLNITKDIMSLLNKQLKFINLN